MKSGSRACGLSYVILTFFKYFSKAFLISLLSNVDRAWSHGLTVSNVIA